MSQLRLREDIRMAKFRQKDATVRWAFMCFVIGFALTSSVLNSVLTAIAGSLGGYLLYGWEVRDLENMRSIGGKK